VYQAYQKGEGETQIGEGEAKRKIIMHRKGLHTSELCNLTEFFHNFLYFLLVFTLVHCYSEPHTYTVEVWAMYQMIQSVYDHCGLF
jgi:hypothetical protein